MVTFECRKCKYHVSKDEAPEFCPFCGEKGTFERQSTAQDLLDA